MQMIPQGLGLGLQAGWRSTMVLRHWEGFHGIGEMCKKLCYTCVQQT